MAKEKSRRKPATPIEIVTTKAEAEAAGAILLPTKQAASLIGVSKEMVIYWANRGYIKKYYVYGNQYFYDVDLREVEIQPELGFKRKHTLYNVNWADVPRNEANNRWVKRSDG